MVAKYDRLTDELQRSCIRLNDELIFTPQKYGKETYFHLEIPSASRFFRVGYHEYVFISLLDGKTTFAHALAVTAQKLGAEALSEQQALRIVNWLMKNGLGGFIDAAAIDSEQLDKQNSNLLQKLNPFWLKIPLGKPNELFDTVEPWCRWMFQPVAVFVSLFTIFTAMVVAATNWDQIAASAGRILAPDNWIWMILIWIVLKVVHELAHGLACRLQGGTVKETGIIFILFAPMAYVDVTSSWRISSRWRRIVIAAAGMYVELFIAAVCVFGWFATSSDIVRQQLVNVIFMASVTSILFNANPLMRFDGYFILSDLLKIPNLHSTGSTSFKNQMQWLFYGQAADQSCCEIRNHRRLIAVYGVCAAVWKVLICIGLTITASVMFGGLGVLLAALGVISWFAKPVSAIYVDLIRRKNSKPHSALRAFAVCSMIAGLFACSWFWIPNPSSSRSPCLVDFEDASKVRTESAGFVEEVFVQDGQHVKAGSPLIRLVNHQLSARVAELQAELEKQRTLERIAMDEHKPGEAQIAERNGQAATKNLVSKQEELDRLLILAPVSGRVVGRNLQQKVGKFVEHGESVLTIGNESSKQIVLSISPDDVRSTIGLEGTRIPIEIGSRRRITAVIMRVEPKAGTHVSHPALIAPNGGQLAVKTNKQNDEGNGNQELELAESRFHAIAQLDDADSSRLFAGECGFALLDSNSNTLGKWLVNSTRKWLEEQLRTASL